jgi:sulfur carrier protein
MRIEVNGEMRDVEEGLTVRGLLLALELGDRLVAVERNAELVPRTRHETTVLCEGDRIEIVEFVGGG